MPGHRRTEFLREAVWVRDKGLAVFYVLVFCLDENLSTFTQYQNKQTLACGIIIYVAAFLFSDALQHL